MGSGQKGPSSKLAPGSLRTHCSARNEEVGLASPGNDLLLKETHWDDKR